MGGRDFMGWGRHGDLEARAMTWRERLTELVTQWKARGASIDTFHATMGIGYKACAEDLSALLTALEPAPEFEVRLKDIMCPQCGKDFQLTWQDYYGKTATLEIRGCPSGGIYDVIISCPHCNYEEPL
jgi:rRNA maturation protein Nop10